MIEEGREERARLLYYLDLSIVQAFINLYVKRDANLQLLHNTASGRRSSKESPWTVVPDQNCSKDGSYLTTFLRSHQAEYHQVLMHPDFPHLEEKEKC